MVEALLRVKRRVDVAVDGVVRLLLALFASVIFVGVITRYLFNLPLAWSEEVSRFSFVWLSLLGAETCLRERGHLGVDLFMQYVPASLRRGIEVGVQVAMGGLLGVLFVGGIELTRVTHAQASPALGMPMSYVYAAVPIGAGLMFLELGLQTLAGRSLAGAPMAPGERRAPHA
jgi:TRAP-type C4-dicarboxylate transport system permease small subunit